MEKRKIKIGLETAQRWYGSSDEELKQLALQTWPEVAEVKLPERWDDLKEIKGCFVTSTSDVRYVSKWQYDSEEKNVFATKEQAEASLALAQLTQLAEVWCDKNGKYGIFIEFDKRVSSVELLNTGGWEFILRFETKEKCNRFIELFEDLILKASVLTL
jgi:uncharacterized protein RhaS with RHS repeats